MLLKNLLPINSDSEISSIEIDSRLVKKGSVFFAMKGRVFDGTKFIESAFEKGAIAVVCDVNSDLSSLKNPADSRIIKVENIQETLISCLQKFYHDLPQNILAVTGTNGKTSVAYFIQQMQEIIGKKSASIGTIGVVVSDDNSEVKKQLSGFELTTPDIASVYKNLAILKANGINDIAIEASSVGLDQKRMAGIKIGVGAFTNFTQDHLDYHGSMEKYFDCKMLLFSETLAPNSIAVLNADIAEFEKIKEIALGKNLRVLSYSANESQKNVDCKISQTTKGIEVEIFGKKYQTTINVKGDFQKSNIACALLSVISYYQLDDEKIEFLITNLPKIKSASGRMQLVGVLKNNAQIFIDYAHTPDALENVLQAAKKIPHNKLHILFGCGGDRDKGKRPQAGKIASELADFVIVTDDNPRTEDAKKIREEILAACDPKKTIEFENRKTAIEQTISKLEANDILIVAGKGHEKYQVIGTQKFEFDEEKIISDFINSIS
ncbi:MAG: murE [Rickettsiaceae bacterium]|jgi:UDP-N-acetylmuramoyl-L-alanyl-D-glutamate--2,6-diaminopimelate ligase|nr:murE [Rickettsiaceae bacterium]